MKNMFCTCEGISTCLPWCLIKATRDPTLQVLCIKYSGYLVTSCTATPSSISLLVPNKTTHATLHSAAHWQAVPQINKSCRISCQDSWRLFTLCQELP